MSSTNKICIIETTYSDKAVGETIIQKLLQKKLAACIQQQQINSHYHWQGKIQNDTEYLLRIKTRCDLYSQVEKLILQRHHYDLPEVIMIPIENASQSYIDWVIKETS